MNPISFVARDSRALPVVACFIRAQRATNTPVRYNEFAQVLREELPAFEGESWGWFLGYARYLTNRWMHLEDLLVRNTTPAAPPTTDELTAYLQSVSRATHVCTSKDAAGREVVIRHMNEANAIIDQRVRQNLGHTDAVTMPVVRA